jgi:hypothetical protein
MANRDISYSVFIDNDTNSEPLSHTLPRRICKWVPDEEVSNCYNCNKYFSIIMRKHHCRVCGKIFCSYCTTPNVHIPEELLSEDSKKGSTTQYVTSYFYTQDPQKHLACFQCKDLITFIDNVKKIITIFQILKIDIITLRTLALVCKSWRNSANYILSIFREIQYKLPTNDYSPFERELLLVNINHITGHSKYIMHLLKSCKSIDDYKLCLQYIDKPKVINCRKMMCGRNCCESLTAFDVIGILSKSFMGVGYNDTLRSAILAKFECSDDEFICYLPFFVYNLKNDSVVIANFLIERCKDSFPLLNALYWELSLYTKDGCSVYNNVFDTLKEMLSNKVYEPIFLKIIDGCSLVRTLQDVSKHICHENKKYNEIKDVFMLKKPMTNPLTLDKIINININKIQIKTSATKPLMIPCDTIDDKTIRILYKNEEVRKDQIIINVFKLADIILKREEGLDLGIITYNVLPIDKTSGLIDIVNNCDTIYSIQEELKSTILNYILENNGEMKVKEIREKFTKSTAVFCVLTYLFGIGDRHLDNIMVTKDGNLFHIDYGYILGNDPVVRNPGIRITSSMIETMGGELSENYKYFKKLCTIIYNCLRRHIDIFINMLLILPKITDINLKEQDIINELIKRFIPGENLEDAELHFDMQLEKQNYMDHVKDWCHYHSKEKTVSNAVSKVSYAMTSLINTIIPDKKSF